MPKSPILILIITSVASITFSVAYLADIDIAYQLEYAKEHRSHVSTLRKPLKICRETSTCFPDWKCSEREELFGQLGLHEQIWAFGRSYSTIFLVLIDNEDRVKRVIPCKS